MQRANSGKRPLRASAMRPRQTPRAPLHSVSWGAHKLRSERVATHAKRSSMRSRSTLMMPRQVGSCASFKDSAKQRGSVHDHLVLYDEEFATMKCTTCGEDLRPGARFGNKRGT